MFKQEFCERCTAEPKADACNDKSDDGDPAVELSSLLSSFGGVSAYLDNGYSVMMSAIPSNSSPPTAQERGLDHLATFVSPDVEPAEFFRELLGILLQTTPAEAIAVWLRIGSTDWMRLSLARSQSDPQPVSEFQQAPEWVLETSMASAMRSIYPAEMSGMLLTGPIRQAGEVTGVLSLQFLSVDPPDSLMAVIPFGNAVCDLAGEFLALRELQSLRQDRLERQQFDQLQAQFASATRFEQFAGMIAHDGRAGCRADRLTVVRFVRARGQVLAVSGVDAIDPRSPVVQALESLALAVREEKLPVLLPASTANAPFLSAWNQLTTIAGTKAAVLKTIWQAPDEPLGTIVAERFSDQADDGWATRISQLTTTATPWWIALEAAQHPWRQGFFRRRRSVRSTAPRIMIAGLIAIVVLVLAMIPVPLKITAEGELTPVERRDVFATANGLVEQVFVKHADRLDIGQSLVQLRDPNVEMEATRITGELATARARLEVIEAARIASTTNAGETPARQQQLAGEAADLRQQCQTLEAQQALLEAEQKSWALQSPIAGQVLTWDVESLLSGRPIERGQVLLTVGNTAGEWEITAHIRERDLRHLLGRENEAIGRRVEFLTALDPTPHLGRVAKVSRVIDLNERGESTVRVTIALDEPWSRNSQTGTTVWPRIHCGPRSLGYVWFHDLIEAARSGIWLRW